MLKLTPLQVDVLTWVCKGGRIKSYPGLSARKALYQIEAARRASGCDNTYQLAAKFARSKKFKTASAVAMKDLK